MNELGGYSRPLTPKQERFAYEYCLDSNATAAARRAGYGGRYSKAASSTAHRLLKHPEVQRIISKAHHQRRMAVGRHIEGQAEQLMVKGTLSLIEYFIMDADGLVRLKSVEELTATQAQGLDHIELSSEGKVCGLRLKEPVDALLELTRLIQVVEPTSPKPGADNQNRYAA